MVVEWVVTALCALARFVVGLFPSFAPPAWLTTTLPDAIRTAGDYIKGVTAWIPLDHVPAALAFVALALAVAGAVKLVRIGASFATFGGGSAA